MRRFASHAVSRATRARRGIALVEALAGGTILGIGLAVLVSIASDASARMRIGEERIVASWLIDEMLNMIVVEGPVEYLKRYDLEGQCAAPFERYSFKLELQDQGDIEPYRVTATITWESGGRPRSETVQTYIAVRRGETQIENRKPGEPITR
ncbi:MAG: hypothetical protein HRU76_11290 [Phycisphaeraceae bacterium]|nr:hypothetical protein [Phycisphaerales bacterium]QOJ18138.1 MAG: hypothetical protein HRU76_11290 [Phycisphaeraceae bacterium]